MNLATRDGSPNYYQQKMRQRRYHALNSDKNHKLAKEPSLNDLRECVVPRQVKLP